VCQNGAKILHERFVIVLCSQTPLCLTHASHLSPSYTSLQFFLFPFPHPKMPLIKPKENSHPSAAAFSAPSSQARIKSNAIMSTPMGAANQKALAWGSARKTPRRGAVNSHMTEEHMKIGSTPKHSTSQFTSSTPSSATIGKNSTLTLPLSHSTPSCSLIFNRSNQTLFLRLRNESSRGLIISLTSLPTALGFSTREVKWEVKAMSDELVSVAWRGKSECRDAMVLQVNGGEQIRVSLRARLAHAEQTQSSPQNPFRTPLAQIKNHTSVQQRPPSSTFSNISNFSALLQTPFGSVQKLKQFQMETQMMRPEQPSSRLEALQMEIQKQKHQQKQWIAALPIHIDDLKEEIARLRSVHKPSVSHLKIGTLLRDTSYNAKLRLLLLWTRIIFVLSGIDESKLDPSDDSLVFQFIVNMYRSQPKKVGEFLKPDQLKRLALSNNDSQMEDSDDESQRAARFPQDSDSWINRFSLIIGLEEYEIPPSKDKKRATQLSTLCHKLLEKRKNSHLMNILLFVQSNVRRNIVQWGEMRQQKAASKIQLRLRSYVVSKKYKLQRQCVFDFQCSFRCILAQQASEVYRSVRHVRCLQSVIRRKQAVMITQRALALVQTTQNRIESLCCSAHTHLLMRNIHFAQNHARFASVWPAKHQRKHVIRLQSSVREIQAQSQIGHLLSITMWTQSNIRTFTSSCERSSATKHILDAQSACRRNITPTLEFDLAALCFVQSKMRMQLCRSTSARASHAMQVVQTLQRVRNDMTSTLIDLVRITGVQSHLRTVDCARGSLRLQQCVTQVQSLLRMQLTEQDSSMMMSPIIAMQSSIRQSLCASSISTEVCNISNVQSMIRTRISTPILVLSQNVSTLQSSLRTHNACRVAGFLRERTAFAQSQLRTVNQIQETQHDRHSIIVIQSLIRCRQQQHHFGFLVQRTTNVQSKIRYFLEMYQSLKMHNKVKRTQRALKRIQVFRRTVHMWDSILVAQRALRATLVPGIDEDSSAIGVVQTLIRSHISSAESVKQVDSVKTIQTLQRFHTASQKCRDAMQNITFVQSHLRTARAVNTLHAQVNSTTLVQTKLRQLREGYPVLTSQFFVRRVQDKIREQRVVHLTHYQLDATVFVQRLVRRLVVPPQQKESSFVGLLQSQIRSQLQKATFQQDCTLVNRAQDCYRSFVDCNMTEEALRRTYNFQRAFRMRLVAPVEIHSQTVTNYQTMTRSGTSQSRTHHALTAINKFQSLARAGQEWASTQQKLAVVGWVQRCIRQQIVTPALKETTATCSVQSVIRSQLQSTQYAEGVSAITSIQSVQRFSTAFFHRIRSIRMITFVQSHLRTSQSEACQESHVAFTKLVQSAIRSRLASQRLISKRRAALKIQSVWKSYVAADVLKYCFDLVKLSQAAIRRNLVPSALGHVKSVVKIQNMVRSIQQQQHTVFLSNSVVPLQSLQRFSQQQQDVSERVCLISKVQSIARSATKHQLLQSHISSITMVQSHLRQVFSEEDSVRFCQSIVEAQSCSRQTACNNSTLRTLYAICNCQKQSQSRQAQQTLDRARSFIIALQSGIRSAQSKYCSEHDFAAVHYVQSAARGDTAKKQLHYQLGALVFAQNGIRCLTQRASVAIMNDNILSCQSINRSRQAMCSFKHAQSFITLVQSQARSQVAQQNMFLTRKAVLMVQAFHQENCKATSERDQFQRSLCQIVHIQACIRGLNSILGTKQLVQTVSKYQRHAQMKHAVNFMQSQKMAVVLCQQYIKGAFVKKHIKEEVDVFVKSSRSALTIQRIFRGYYSRKHEFVQQQTELEIRLQKVREEFEERKRIELKTRAGLRILLKSKKMSSAMKACSDLDHATSVSTKSCESMCNEDALLQLMYLIKTCNRSEPHVKLLIHILNILINVSKDGFRADHVFNTKDCIDILVEQLQMYRDKPEVFLRAMKILELLVIPKNAENHTSPRYQRMEKIKEMTTTIGRMHGVASVLEGKYKLEKKFQETQRAQVSRQSLSRTRLSISSSNRRMSTMASKTSNKQSPVILCYEALVTFLRKIEGKIKMSETKTEDQLTIEDRRLTVSARRATISSSEALDVLHSSRRDSFAAPMDRRLSIAPARRNTISRRSISTEKSRPSMGGRSLKKKKLNSSLKK